MATVPTTLIVNILNTKLFPIEMAMVVMKQLFKFGVKDIVQKSEDCIIILLKYSPKMVTLNKKFGNLPVRYTRAAAESESQIALLQKAVKRFRFALDNDDDEEPSTSFKKLKNSSSTPAIEDVTPPSITTKTIESQEETEEEFSQNAQRW